MSIFSPVYSLRISIFFTNYEVLIASICRRSDKFRLKKNSSCIEIEMCNYLKRK